MVVHISAGHHSGTLVNALLHHCGLPGLSLDQVLSGSQPQPELAGDDSADTDEDEEAAEEEPGAGAPPVTMLPSSGRPGDEADSVIRPGIVHRLDKGTSGLLVVAKQVRGRCSDITRMLSVCATPRLQGSSFQGRQHARQYLLQQLCAHPVPQSLEHTVRRSRSPLLCAACLQLHAASPSPEPVQLDTCHLHPGVGTSSAVLTVQGAVCWQGVHLHHPGLPEQTVRKVRPRAAPAKYFFMPTRLHLAAWPHLRTAHM